VRGGGGRGGKRGGAGRSAVRDWPPPVAACRPDQCRRRPKLQSITTILSPPPPSYSIIARDTSLVLWEAQFGDFANNAQVGVGGGLGWHPQLCSAGGPSLWSLYSLSV
jgi:hypothetical protein